MIIDNGTTDLQKYRQESTSNVSNISILYAIVKILFHTLSLYVDRYIYVCVCGLRLMFSSCGAAQWRLQGPGKWSGAVETVKSVPMTDAMHYIGIALLILAGLLLSFVCFILCGYFRCLF